MKRRKQSCALQQILWRPPTVVDLGKSRSYSMHYFFFNQAHKTEGGKHTNALFLCSPGLYVSACLSLRAHWKQRAPPPLLLSFRASPPVFILQARPSAAIWWTQIQRPLIELPLAATGSPLHSQSAQHSMRGSSVNAGGLHPSARLTGEVLSGPRDG